MVRLASRALVLAGVLAVGLPACTAEPSDGATPRARMGQSCTLGAEVQTRVRELFALGTRLGQNPRAFSKVGDSISAWDFFLKGFERARPDGSPYHTLTADWQQDELDHFAGSFGRTSFAAVGGWSSGIELLPRYAPKDCVDTDGKRLPPLLCEFERHRPALAVIMLGTNDVGSRFPLRPTKLNPDWNLEAHLRWILDRTLERGIIPVLSTIPPLVWRGDSPTALQPAADQANLLIRELATSYRLPLVEFDRALRRLPRQGLSSDGIHPSWEWQTLSTDLRQADTYGFTQRNLLTLEMLAAVRSCVAADAPSPDAGPAPTTPSPVAPKRHRDLLPE